MFLQYNFLQKVQQILRREQNHDSCTVGSSVLPVTPVQLSPAVSWSSQYSCRQQCPPGPPVSSSSFALHHLFSDAFIFLYFLSLTPPLLPCALPPPPPRDYHMTPWVSGFRPWRNNCFRPKKGPAGRWLSPLGRVWGGGYTHTHTAAPVLSGHTVHWPLSKQYLCTGKKINCLGMKEWEEVVYLRRLTLPGSLTEGGETYKILYKLARFIKRLKGSKSRRIWLVPLL